MAVFRLDGYVRAAAESAHGAVAVRDGNAVLTYAQLDAVADQVAATLISQGVSPGDRVALYGEKTIEAVAALYGILRAGAAYVPVDVRSPVVRAEAILRDADVTAVVVDAERLAVLRDLSFPGVTTGVVLDGSIRDRRRARPDDRIDPDVPIRQSGRVDALPAEVVRDSDPASGFVSLAEVVASPRHKVAVPTVDLDVAYILYTSGSTGLAKGVVLSHRNALTFVEWARAEFGLTNDDVLASPAPLHFDLSTLDIFGAAAAAATVTIVPHSAATFPVRLADWISSERVSVWYSVPSALVMLVRFGALRARSFDSLRLVLFAGEVFSPRYLTQLMRDVPQPRYVNLYGPTETNVCTHHTVTEPPGEGEVVPIGRACANTRCEVLDESGARVTAAGARGELVVTGSIVALGYWRRPEGTGGFIGRHTYRTGDIVQILDVEANPRYLFMGRADYMVKTRGYRVELGEIETALQAEPGVTDAVAVAVPDEMFGARVIAFCAFDVPSGSRGVHPEGSLSAEEKLRASCRRRLPEYMVPDRIVIDDSSLPVLSNGKHDRQALTRRALQGQYRSPVTSGVPGALPTTSDSG